MSPDTVMGLIFAAVVLGGVLLISLGYSAATKGNGIGAGSQRRDSSGSQAALFVMPGVSDGGAHCSPGDGGGGCDGGGCGS
jgi:hypothetical protein